MCHHTVQQNCLPSFSGKTLIFLMFFSIQLSVSFLYSVFNEHSRCSSPSHHCLCVSRADALSRFLRSPPTHNCLCVSRADALSRMVGSSGLEPPTSRLSGGCSNQLSYKPICRSFPTLARHYIPVMLGGDDGIRTHDPLLAGQVLSQLSYTPIQGALHVSSGTLSDPR